ncbi:hypothetical protein BZA70DRAFT_256649 [Myxozyma melibiosi]|uniref:Uncharacterized protein n=1 Tax=Myxozyma melibiosi TaxID=54550 RepID=A0ABR1F7N9_9ASCO
MNLGSLSFWTWFNVFTNGVYLSLIILTIPLAFDVGGQECGLAFTLTLAVFYFSMATIRLLGRNTQFSTITHIVYYSQHVIIPSLFIMFLNIYSDSEHTYAVWSRILIPWRYFLENATAGFTILEGFCTLLVIQAAGQISRYLVKRNSDLWTIILLVAAANIVTCALYFLYRIYTFPITIGSVNATMIGAMLTCTIFLGGYGIVSRRGNLIESSLLFGYMVFCLYETFTDFHPNQTEEGSGSSASSISSGGSKTEFPPFPPIIMESYATIVASLASTVPSSFATTFEFILAAMSTITPSIVVSLMYRLLVLFATTQIIPALRETGDERGPVPRSRSSSATREGAGAGEGVSDGAVGAEGARAEGDGAESIKQEEQEDGEGASTGQLFVRAYAPCVLIAVYSHLLMQHFGYLRSTTTVGGFEIATWQLWSWVNSGVTLALYASEMMYGKESRGESLARHWKME